jgi:acetyl esterase/lipase
MKIIISLLLLSTTTIFGQKTVNLYEKVPGQKSEITVQEKDVSDKKDGIIRLRDVTNPTLTIYTPKKKTSDAAVIICPGGGYRILAFDHEGTRIAEWFAAKGVTAFVLKYRLPQPELFENAEIRPLQDAQQAIRYIKTNAKLYGVSTNKIGIMGFSAGGHLAATTSTHFYNQVGEITNEKVSVRPDFTILMYPVVSFSDKYGHMGSRDNLIGQNPSTDKIDFYSNELQVKSDTPPAFLVHAFDDPIKIENSISYYKALRSNNIASEMHFYDAGGHGFGMKKDLKGPVATWPNRLEDWMKLHGWM